VFLGQVEEETHLMSDVTVGRTDVGGWGGYMQARYARHREHHLAEHTRRVVEHLWAIDRSRPLHAIVLAGPDEALAVLRRALPPTLARAVAGQMPGEMFASTADVVRHVAAIEEEAREREDRALVEQVEQRLGKHSDVTVGWDETLQALAEGRVHVMLLPAGASGAGVQCPTGDFLATVSREVCPMCGEALFATDDIVEAAVRTAVQRDSLVRFLAPGASKLLAPRGIAGLLRY
jgi:peptide subunit release factor 1 (eRF1)